MDKDRILQELVEENNGYLFTSMATKEGITKPYLARYVKKYGLERVARGIYITDDVWPDELYIMQARSAAVIFFGETALYLHDLIDREYTKICVSVPVGYNATHLKKGKADSLQVRYAAKALYELGVCMVSSDSGNMVRAYDKERCICDLIADRDRIEVQDLQTALKGYMFGKDKRLSKLIGYAEKIGIIDEVMKYVEVLV